MYCDLLIEKSILELPSLDSRVTSLPFFITSAKLSFLMKCSMNLYSVSGTIARNVQPVNFVLIYSDP